MNNRNDNFYPIAYKGEVSIKVVSNGRIIKKIKTHNSGMPWLFQQITSALAYKSINKNYLPSKIELFKGANPSNLISATNGNSIDILNSYVEPVVGNFYAVFNCTVPWETINTDEWDGSSDLREIRMYDKTVSSSHQLAFISIPAGEFNLKDLSSGQSLVVEWRMMFLNVQTTQSTVNSSSQESQSAGSDEVDDPENEQPGDNL